MTQSLTDHLLIAMPRLADPNFAHSVTYVCEHSEQGAMGIVINRQMDLSLAEILDHLEIERHDPRLEDRPVLAGGPVETERGFVIHTPPGDWDSSLRVSGQVAVTTSRDVLEAIGADRGPRHYRVALGYAGWSAGQLEKELGENTWLSTPATFELLFETGTDQLWNAAAGQLGVDINLMSGDAGHA